jgi:NitT/TauT family transport system substrate-binding protein
MPDRFRLLASAAVLAAGALPAAAADPVTFQLDWLPGGDKSAIYVCIDQGFCEEAGLDVTIASGRGSSDAITKLAAGSSDIGVADIGALMAAVVQENVGVTAVLSIFNKGPHAFYFPKDAGVTSVADVRGKKIATSPFTSSNVFLPLVLEDVGMGEDDITLIKADPGALGPMLMTGNVDGIIAWMTDLSRYNGQAAEAGKELVAIPWSAAGLELYSASLIASDSFLAEQPDVARRFVAAYAKSLEAVQADPDAAAASVTAVVSELGVEDVKGSVMDTMPLIYNEVTEVDGLGVFEPARLAETWSRVSVAQGLDPASLDPETIVDRSFMPAD